MGYKDIFEKLDGRWIENAKKREFLTEDDGGIASRVAEIHNDYISSMGKLSIQKHNSEEAYKVVDAYVDLLLHNLVPADEYNAIQSALGKLEDPLDKRDYRFEMAKKYLNLDESTLKRKHKELMNHGRIDSLVYDLNNMVNDPQNGLAQAKGSEELIREVQKEGNAIGLLEYFNSHVLKKKGYELDEAQRLKLGINPNEAIGLMQNVSAGILTADMIDKYGLKPVR